MSQSAGEPLIQILCTFQVAMMAEGRHTRGRRHMIIAIILLTLHSTGYTFTELVCYCGVVQSPDNLSYAIYLIALVPVKVKILDTILHF